MNKRQQLSQQISILRSKVVNAATPYSPWNVYDAKVVEEFIGKVLEIFKE